MILNPRLTTYTDLPEASGNDVRAWRDMRLSRNEVADEVVNDDPRSASEGNGLSTAIREQNWSSTPDYVESICNGATAVIEFLYTLSPSPSPSPPPSSEV